MYFADSFRLMPNALKAIGKTVNLEKIDVDRSHIETLSFAEQVEYCYRDCDIALKGLQHMRQALTSVNADFAFTLASVASRWVRRSPTIDFDRFYRPVAGKLVYDPGMEAGDRWCEPAYFGGRCEIFKRGKFTGPIYYYDIVSSYPTSMTLELPLYYKGLVPPPRKTSASDIDRYLSYAGITEATVRIPKLPVQPLCIRHMGRLTFPRGIVRGRWTNLELREAVARGVEIEVHGQCRYESKAFLNPFVQTFYGLRKQAKKDKDPFRTYAYKILLNSLYGKLVETLDRSAYVTSKHDIRRAKEMGGKVLSTKVPGVYQIQSQEEGPFRHVAAGAYVTAYSRLRLLQGLEAALAKGGEIYYCDTDSIMTNVPLPELEGFELGQWQHEYTFDELEIVLPKVYRAVLSSSSPSHSPTFSQSGPDAIARETLYRCKGMPIVREDEPPDFPELRWEAFKHYARTGDPEMAKLLSRDGLSGFVADINSGTLRPRRLPLLRALKGEDKKREWHGSESEPLHLEIVKG
jgi:DNA polymerase elongation subunit (family B)